MVNTADGGLSVQATLVTTAGPGGGGGKGSGGAGDKVPSVFSGACPSRLCPAAILRSMPGKCGRGFAVLASRLPCVSCCWPYKQAHILRCPHPALPQHRPSLPLTTALLTLRPTPPPPKGPRELSVPLGGAGAYPLTFRPPSAGAYSGRLELLIPATGERICYALTGWGGEPLEEGRLLVECQVRAAGRSDRHGARSRAAGRCPPVCAPAGAGRCAALQTRLYVALRRAPRCRSRKPRKPPPARATPSPARQARCPVQRRLQVPNLTGQLPLVYEVLCDLDCLEGPSTLQCTSTRWAAGIIGCGPA